MCFLRSNSPERFQASGTLAFSTRIEKSKFITKLFGQLCPCYGLGNGYYATDIFNCFWL